MSAPPVLETQGLSRLRDGKRVLDGIDLEVAAGETLGIIGGSGSGKTPLARLLMGLDRPDAGTVRFQGAPLWSGAGLRAAIPTATRLRIQAVFQDPYASLDPRKRIGWSVAEPLLSTGMGRTERSARVAGALAEVALPPDAVARFPHQFSGGQRQRIAIARALVNRPAVVIADEPVSALDVSVQAQVLNLLVSVRERFGLALVFISHDLDVVRHVAHRVAVLDAGRIVEQGPAGIMLDRPAHPVTRAMLAARPGTHRPGPAR